MSLEDFLAAAQLQSLSKAADRATKGMNKTDMSLIDVSDELLSSILDSLTVYTAMGSLSDRSITTMICQAYAAGRMRGRKEGVMRGLLEGVEDEG